MFITKLRWHFVLTLIRVRGRHRQHSCSCRLILRDLCFVLGLFKQWGLIIYINHVDAQQLTGRVLGYPMILSDYGEVEDILLLTVQRLGNGKGACVEMSQKLNVINDLNTKKTTKCLQGVSRVCKTFPCEDQINANTLHPYGLPYLSATTTTAAAV